MRKLICRRCVRAGWAAESWGCRVELARSDGDDVHDGDTSRGGEVGVPSAGAGGAREQGSTAAR